MSSEEPSTEIAGSIPAGMFCLKKNLEKMCSIYHQNV